MTLFFQTTLSSKIINNWIDTDSENIIKSQVISRIAYLFIFPIRACEATADGLIEIGVKLLTLVTAGTHNWSSHSVRTYAHTNFSSYTITSIYGIFLRVINPNASSYGFRTPKITSIVTKKLCEIGSAHAASDIFLKKHITSRLTYALLAITQIITYVADFLIGIVAALYSVGKLGTDYKANSFAGQQLQLLGCISDFIKYTTYAINPWTKVLEPSKPKHPY